MRHFDMSKLANYVKILAHIVVLTTPMQSIYLVSGHLVSWCYIRMLGCLLFSHYSPWTVVRWFRVDMVPGSHRLQPFMVPCGCFQPRFANCHTATAQPLTTVRTPSSHFRFPIRPGFACYESTNRQVFRKYSTSRVRG